MDLKDSMSCVLFFMDSLTWPETVKAYFQTEINSYARPLEIMEENTEYPLIMEKVKNAQPLTKQIYFQLRIFQSCRITW